MFFLERIYNKNWLVIAILIIFLPFGMFLLYKSNGFAPKKKIIIAIATITLSLTVNYVNMEIKREISQKDDIIILK